MRPIFSEEADALIARYLENKCTVEEKKKIFKLFGHEYFDKLLKSEMLSLLNDFEKDKHEVDSADFDKIYNKINEEITRREIIKGDAGLSERRKKIKRLIIQGISIAAVFLIAFFLGSLINRSDTVTKPLEVSKAASVNIIKAPFGARSEIILGDGTEIMLNAGSTIRYHGDYNLINRDLVLEGEAYFKVAKNSSLPLVVYAGNLHIKATGTEFNVKAYSEEGVIETTLVDGEVEISQKGNINRNEIVVLKPNQKAIYTSESDRLTLENRNVIKPQEVNDIKVVSDNLMVSVKTDVEQVTAWTQNKLIIRSENLESLCTKLQRKYNVTFVFRDEEIKRHRFSGILLDETFSQIMDVIKLTAPVDYEMDGKTVYLFSNKTVRSKN